MALLVGTGFMPVTNVQASTKVGTTTAKVKNTAVGADLTASWTAVSGTSGYDVYMSAVKNCLYIRLN